MKRTSKLFSGKKEKDEKKEKDDNNNDKGASLDASSKLKASKAHVRMRRFGPLLLNV
jgi:hypothetical protein